jgi:hypothetical protein
MTPRIQKKLRQPRSREPLHVTHRHAAGIDIALAFTGSSSLGAMAVWQNNSASISPALTQISTSAGQDKLLNRRSMAGAIGFGPLIAEVASRPSAPSERLATLPLSPLNDGETSQTVVSRDGEESGAALSWLFGHAPHLDGIAVWAVFEGNEVPDSAMWSLGIGAIEE